MSSSLFTYFGEDSGDEPKKSIVPCDTGCLEREVHCISPKERDTNPTSQSETTVKDQNYSVQPASFSNVTETMQPPPADTEDKKPTSQSEATVKDQNYSVQPASFSNVAETMQPPPADTEDIKEVTREDTAFASEKADAEEDIRRYMKENAKMIAEESLELPIRIKGIEAPPLTPEQLKLIPTLMEVVHVGHNADVKTEQKWIKNCPKELLEKATSVKRPNGKCMFGMVFTDTPRNHNWTAFKDLDDCMKNNKEFNFKPNREDIFHDAKTDPATEDDIPEKQQCPFLRARSTSAVPEIAQDDSLDKQKCPFLRTRDVGLVPQTDKVTSSEKAKVSVFSGRQTVASAEKTDEAASSDKAKSPIFSGQKTVASAEKQNDSESDKSNISSDLNQEKLRTSEIHSANRMKLEELTKAMHNYRKQLEEFQNLQNELLSLKQMHEATEETASLVHRGPLQENKESQFVSSTSNIEKSRRKRVNFQSRPGWVDNEIIRKLFIFGLMFVIAQVMGQMFK